jgi:tetratricopeptide (TPR) repeat protein
MIRKNFLTSLFTIVIIAAAAVAALAQTGAPVSGQVLLTEGDKTTPVVGALVEVYRVDIKAKFPSDKTDKKGYFRFAGLPFGARFALVISGPGISPEIIPGIKAGDEKVVVNVKPGNGQTWSEDEVRKALANVNSDTPKSQESDEDKKNREALEKQRLEVEAKNKRILETNEIVEKAVTEGNKALNEKNWEAAVTSFRAGYEADPTFSGTAPFFLNSLALALYNRGTDRYNASVKMTDQTAKAAQRDLAKADFDESVLSCERSLEILKTATAADPTAQKNIEVNKYKAIELRKNAFRLMAQTGVNRTRGKDAAVAFAEYLAAETDPAKKTKGQMDLAMTLQDSDEFESAIVEFRKILVEDPNNVDALVGLGLSLVTVGYVTMDADQVKGKAELQEAANTLQKFADLAPETHKLRQSALDSIAQLKDIVTPQKPTKPAATTRKKN